MRAKALFVAWTEVSRRSDELAKRLAAEYFRLERKEGPPFSRLMRLVTNGIKTFIKFLRTGPGVIFSFHAHPFITLTSTLYRLLNGCKVVPDVHTAAYTDYDFFPVNSLSLLLWRTSDLVIVHNRQSWDLLRRKHPFLGDKLFVFEDPIPALPSPSGQDAGHWENRGTTGVLISRFSDDEPIQSFLDAVAEHRTIHFYVTGDYRKATFPLTGYETENVSFTGFLHERSYVSLLRSADFVVVLTTRENTLLSGGYEALSLGKPMIVSDTETLRHYFSESVIYTRPHPSDISSAIGRMVESLDRYAALSAKTRDEKIREWEEKKKEFLELLGMPASSG